MLIYLKDNEVVAWNKIINFDDAQEFINNSSCVWTDKDFDFNNIPQEENKEAKVYYENGDFVVKYFNIPALEPTEDEIIQGEMLLNQAQIIATQNEQDEVLAAILLNQMEV